MRRLSIVKKQLINYTDQQAFDYVKQYYPESFKVELAPCVSRIINISHKKRVPAERALNIALADTNTKIERIYLLASFYTMRTKQTFMHRSIKTLENEINHRKNQITQINESSLFSEDYKKINKSKHEKDIALLHLEIAGLRTAREFISDIPVTGQVIQANGSQSQI